MDEESFETRARAALRQIEDGLDEVDPDDVDYSSSEGVLTLEMRDRAKVVVNSHRAARQIWMAAVDTAWHFDFVASERVWRSPKGDELFATLHKLIAEHTNVEVTF